MLGSVKGTKLDTFNGIYDYMVEDEPTFEEVLPKFINPKDLKQRQEGKNFLDLMELFIL